MKEKKFNFEDGIKLVDEYAKFYKAKKEAERKLESLKRNLVDFAKERKITSILGADFRCSLRKYEKVVYPADKKEELIRTMKEKGIYEEFSTLNHFKLNPRILKKEVDDWIINFVDIEEAHRLSLKKRGDVVKGVKFVGGGEI
jgi:hypothetical protein